MHPGTRGGAQFVGVAIHQRAVVVDVAHPQVDAAGSGVRLAGGHDRFDQLDHLGDPLRGLGPFVGRENAQRFHRLDVHGVPFGGHIGFGAALALGLVDDLVVDVGDIGDMDHVEAKPLQVAPQHVIGQRGARMTEVRVIVNRRPAGIDQHPPRLPSLQRPHPLRQRVIKLNHLARCRRASRAPSALEPLTGPNDQRSTRRPSRSARRARQARQGHHRARRAADG